MKKQPLRGGSDEISSLDGLCPPLLVFHIKRFDQNMSRWKRSAVSAGHRGSLERVTR